MQTAKLIVLISQVLISCSSMNESKDDGCNENLKFKKNVLYNISIVERYTVERTTVNKHIVDTKAFLKSLTFISHYTSVSWGKTANYQIGYPTLQLFKSDKDHWLKWYDANKCKNLRQTNRP
jgi:hypothetical protein